MEINLFRVSKIFEKVKACSFGTVTAHFLKLLTIFYSG